MVIIPINLVVYIDLLRLSCLYLFYLKVRVFCLFCLKKLLI